MICNPSRKRKTAQLVIALSAVLLLISEILGEVYYGNLSPMGYWMVRICNLLVYLMTLSMIHAFSLYLADVFRTDLNMPVPKQLKVTLTDAALNAVIDRGFDPVFGARPLKRYLQSKVETLIARRVIAADVAPGTELTVDLDENGEIVIR